MNRFLEISLVFLLYSAQSIAARIDVAAQVGTVRHVAEAYFRAYSTLDFEKMGNLYVESENSVFEDPGFGQLNTIQARGMLKMLVYANKANSAKTGVAPLAIKFKIINISEEQGLAEIEWTAKYQYSETGRVVKNQITTIMKVAEGKIVAQKDDFNLCKWTNMALGFPTSIICLAPQKLQAMSRAKLEEFMAKVK